MLLKVNGDNFLLLSKLQQDGFIANRTSYFRSLPDVAKLKLVPDKTYKFFRKAERYEDDRELVDWILPYSSVDSPLSEELLSLPFIDCVLQTYFSQRVARLSGVK